MIAASLKDGEDLVNLFLSKEVDVNQTSRDNCLLVIKEWC